MKILKRKISIKYKPFIVAEMSANHNKSFERAIKIIDLAAKSGADAIKLQTYSAEGMTLNLPKKEFKISEKNSLWKGQHLFNLYSKASTPKEWHKDLFQYAKEKKILCFSSPFDERSVDFLEKFDPPCYKIASFEIVDIPLIRHVAKTGKPVIVSTGMASVAEINDALDELNKWGNNNYALLKCTSTYPAKASNSNLATISHMKKLFNCEIGLSDHTFGIGASLASIVHGSTIIERHFTIKRSDGGVDSAFSLEPHEMKQLVKESETVWKSIGEVKYGPLQDEKQSLLKRRSIYVVRNVKKGMAITKKDIKRIRPGFGLSPKYWDIVLRMKFKKNIKIGTPLKWDLID